MGLDQRFYSKLFLDPVIAQALRPANPEDVTPEDWAEEDGTTEWDRNAGDGGSAFEWDDAEDLRNLPFKRHPLPLPMPGRESQRPTLRRPGEASPLAPPGYGTRDYADKQSLFPGMPPGPAMTRPGPRGLVDPRAGQRMKQLGGWKGIVGGLIGGALAGGTAGVGGGPVGAMRAMQAGRDEGQRQDLLRWEMQRRRNQELRQYDVDEQNRKLHEAQMENYRAQAEERRTKANSYEAQLAAEREDAYRRGDEAAIKAVEAKLERYRLHGAAAKPVETPEARMTATANAIRRVMNLPPGTSDDEAILAGAKMNPQQRALVEYFTAGKYSTVPVEKPVETLDTRTKALATAIRTIKGLPPETSDEDALRTTMSPEERSRAEFMVSGKFGTVPAGPRPAAPSAPHYITNKKTGVVTVVWRDENGKDMRTATLEGLASPDAPGGAAAQYRTDLTEAKRQAELVWQNSAKWLQQNGKLGGKPETAVADNEAITQLALDNASNPEFFGNDSEFQRLLGLIGDQIRTIGKARKLRSPTKADAGVGAFTAAAQEALAKQGATGAIGAGGPTAAPPAPPPQVTPPAPAPPPQVTPPAPAPPPAAAPGPTGPTGATGSVTGIGWPPLPGMQTGEKVEPKPKPAAKGAAPKGPAKVFPTVMIPQFFRQKGQELGFRTQDDAKKWLVAHGYAIK